MKTLGTWLIRHSESIGLSMLAILAPIKPLLLTTGFLIFGDLITGIWASVKEDKKITSNAMGRTITKIVLYNLAIISGFLIETYILDNSVPIAKIVAGAISIVEFKSLSENIYRITGLDLMKEIKTKLNTKSLTSKKED